MTIMATSEAYKVLGEKIQVTPANDLDKYIYYTDLQSVETTDIFYHVERQVVKLRWWFWLLPSQKSKCIKTFQ